MGLSRAGKVIRQTPKVEPKEKPKKKTGRAAKRKLLNKRNAEKENKEKEQLFYLVYNPPEKREVSIIKRKELGLVEGCVIFEGNDPIFLLHSEPSIKIERNLLMEILRRENEIRLSDEIQDKYTNMKYNWDDPEDYDGFLIDRSCQIQALREFGFNPGEDDSLEAYQISCGIWVSDPEVSQCVVWMKYCKMRFGDLKCGDTAPNANLFTLDGKSIELYSFIQQDRPLILVGGSYS